MPDSLRDRYAPNDMCFGCGPRNKEGLRLKSVPRGDDVVADWKPKAQRVGFGNFGSGGINSVFMDRQGNWGAAYALLKSTQLSSPPGTVTSEYTVKFLNPPPIGPPWQLAARATAIDEDRVSVSGELRVENVVTATMTGLFIAVGDSHPAFHWWQ
jgi:hypothetical protein